MTKHKDNDMSKEDELSKKIELFINSIRKETGASKNIVLKGFAQNDYRFIKEPIIDFIRTHSPKF